MRLASGPRIHRLVLAVIPAIASLGMLVTADAQAGLLDDLKNQVENAVKKELDPSKKEVVECAADDAKCARKAAKQGKEVRIIPSGASSAASSGGEVNPYLRHALSDHPAYQLANQLAGARSEQEVAELMRTAFKTINVGIYTPDGHQILAGAERKPTDFFLYDFQWKILARAFFEHNGVSFDSHSQMLGAALLELKDPAPLSEALATAIERRYQEAVQKPDDKMNFIVLLMDGLARQQMVPYSLAEPYRFTDARIRVDPLQSTLIMLEFFSHPPAKPNKFSFDWFPSPLPAAQAMSPCDLIKGDDEQGYYGRGTDILGEIGGELPGAAGKAIGVLGNAAGVAGAFGDLLVLYGMNIKLTPQPYVIHLLHPGEGSIAAIQADVTFDSQGVPDSVLKCGWLAGKQMPPNGGLKDVELTWDFSPALQPKLAVHSSMFEGYGDKNDKSNHIIATSGGLRTITDEFGRSIFMIQPSDCPSPSGKLLEQNYMASVDARYVTRSIPTPGLLGFGLILKLGPGAAEYLMRGRSGYARFMAQWHEKAPPPKQY